VRGGNERSILRPNPNKRLSNQVKPTIWRDQPSTKRREREAFPIRERVKWDKGNRAFNFPKEKKARGRVRQDPSRDPREKGTHRPLSKGATSQANKLSPTCEGNSKKRKKKEGKRKDRDRGEARGGTLYYRLKGGLGGTKGRAWERGC